MLEVSRSGYYAWKNRGISKREQRRQVLLRAIVELHQKHPAFGLDSIYHKLKPLFYCSRNMVHRLMKEYNIHSIRKRAYKVTTNSKHNCPIAPNLLNRDFSSATPNKVWVGDITYIPTDEGWLYTAIVKDLCTKKIVGYAFSNRIDTSLVKAALDMAVRREKPDKELIFHSDRGNMHLRNTEKRLSITEYVKVCHARETHMTTLLQKTFSVVSSVRWYITSISILDHKRGMLYLNTLNHFTILCVLIRVLAGILPQSLKDSCETHLPLNQ